MAVDMDKTDIGGQLSMIGDQNLRMLGRKLTVLCITSHVSDLLPEPQAQIFHCQLDICTWK